MKNIIIANWKCNPNSLKEAKKLYSEVSKKAKAKNTEVVICPPFVYLGLLKGKNLGAQNICFDDGGAFTGEVSASMIKDLGIEYVMIGHSERRKYFNETNLYINSKIKKSLELGLKPILCVGETKQEFEAHLKPDVLEAQITEALKDVTDKEAINIIFVYEPVWAISTNEGENCSAQEAKVSIAFMKKIISEIYNKEILDKIRFVYGGSVESFNSDDYLKHAEVSGLLVGGASLKAEEFIAIVKSVE